MNPDGIRRGKIMKAAVKVKNLTKSFGKEKEIAMIRYNIYVAGFDVLINLRNCRFDDEAVF